MPTHIINKLLKVRVIEKFLKLPIGKGNSIHRGLNIRIMKTVKKIEHVYR